LSSLFFKNNKIINGIGQNFAPPKFCPKKKLAKRFLLFSSCFAQKKEKQPTQRALRKTADRLAEAARL